MNDKKKLAVEYDDFRVIEETNKYILGHLWEQAYLYNKVAHNETLLCDFYGDCEAGAINDKDDWCVVGGDIIAIWKNDNITIFDKDELRWVNDIRIKDGNTVEILIDPWSDNSAIWELNIEDISFKKICSFNKYKEKPYTDKVDW